MSYFRASGWPSAQSTSPFRNDDEKVEWLLRRLEDPTHPLPGADEEPWVEGPQPVTAVNRSQNPHDLAQAIADKIEREIAAGSSGNPASNAQPLNNAGALEVAPLTGTQLVQGAPIQAPQMLPLTGPLDQRPILSFIETRDDADGRGHFLADRDRGRRKHRGHDLLAAPGEIVTSPVDGMVTGIPGAYLNPPPSLSRFTAVHVRGADGREYVMRYVTNRDQAGSALVKPGDNVTAGQPVGTVQDRASAMPFRPLVKDPMRNHVHFEIRDRGAGPFYDPGALVRHWMSQQGH